MMTLISTIKTSDLIANGFGKYIFGVTDMSDVNLKKCNTFANL